MSKKAIINGKSTVKLKTQNDLVLEFGFSKGSHMGGVILDLIEFSSFDKPEKEKLAVMNRVRNLFDITED